MRARWTQRRAWAVWILVSLIAWGAVGVLFTALLKDDLAKTAEEADTFNPSDVAPATGPTAK